ISNRRLIAADENGVTFRYKDYRIEGPARYTTMTLDTHEFIRRFLMHVLPPQIEIRVALLDCHDVVRLDRLRTRGTHGATQEMLSWAAWQRVHAVDPQWRQDVICDVELDDMRWERWTDWHRGDPRWRVRAIDTTELRIDQVVERIASWMRAEQLTRK